MKPNGTVCFEYGDREVEYLKSRARKFSPVIDRIGHISRPCDTDLFSSVVHHILGQQIQAKAQQTLWRRMNDGLGMVTADTLLRAGRDRIQAFGTTYKKADYILDFAQKVQDGQFNLDAVEQMTDEEAVRALCNLKGIGVWTAEMILLFCLQRPDILSFGDLAILRGMRMVYHYREIDRQKFEKVRRRLSPCGSVASLYFWAVAGGAIPEMKDFVPRKFRQN